MNDITSSFEKGKLTIYLQRDIDHHVAAEIRQQIDKLIGQTVPSLVVLNFDAVEFMDSSGIGLIMGRYKRMQEMGGALTVTALRPRCRKLVELSGITRIIEIKE